MNLHTYLRLITWRSVGGKQANKEAREHLAESMWGRKAFLLPQVTLCRRPSPPSFYSVVNTVRKIQIK